MSILGENRLFCWGTSAGSVGEFDFLKSLQLAREAISATLEAGLDLAAGFHTLWRGGEMQAGLSTGHGRAVAAAADGAKHTHSLSNAASQLAARPPSAARRSSRGTSRAVYRAESSSAACRSL